MLKNITSNSAKQFINVIVSDLNTIISKEIIKTNKSGVVPNQAH